MQNKKGKSTQDLIGIKGFSRYGLSTARGELVFFVVSPTNISVLSAASVETKIRHLMTVLQSIPDIEIACLDSCECFDENKSHIRQRMTEESNPKVRDVLEKDYEFFDHIQVEMSTARQFMFIARIKKERDEQALNSVNRVEKTISDQGFEVKRVGKVEIKRILAIYFEASLSGDLMPDVDGGQYFADEIKNAQGAM